MNFSPRELMATLRQIPERKLLWINLGAGCLVALSHVAAYMLAANAAGATATNEFAPMVYFSVPLACAVAAAAIAALILPRLTFPVLALHGLILAISAAAILAWSISVFVSGPPAGNFRWTPGLLSVWVFYAVYSFTRYTLPQSVSTLPAIALAPVIALLLAMTVDLGMLVQLFRGASTVEMDDLPNPPDPSLIIPKAQIEPAVPELVQQGPVSGETTSILSTSFETRSVDSKVRTTPFHQAAQIPWGHDERAHSGNGAVNVIPQGNPGRLGYLNKAVNAAKLSSRLDGTYAPFAIGDFRRIGLEFWYLSTSNPSETHNCLGSLHVEYRFDDGQWESKMVYCGRFRAITPDWKQAKLEFDTTGHRQLEFRFEYEYPPDTRVDKTAVYLIDDLTVSGIK